MAAGREDARAVKAYLEAIESGPKKRGRQRTVQSITKRLEAIDQALKDASALVRLQLIQERSDLEAELAQKQGKSQEQLPDLREAFIKAAKAYSERKGIGYGSWRAVGVDAETLKAAGITRSG